jgi:citrate synthase
MAQIKTDIGYTTIDAIMVRGQNLANDLIGTIDFVDMIVLTALGRLPSEPEKKMLNALLVTVTDHGLTPSAIAARMTYLGAPEALQAAVAAGLLGAGSVFLGTMENAATMLRTAASDMTDEAGDTAWRDRARQLIEEYRAERRLIVGVGHPIHVNGDPRVPVLKRLSEETGFYGKHWRLLRAIEDVLRSEFRKRLPINAAGAIGAIVADMGLPSSFARGVALIGRCAGLVAHLLEEQQAPTGQAIWDLVLAQDARNELP